MNRGVIKGIKMKILVFIKFFLLNVYLLSSESSGISTPDKLYTFTYISHNISFGPTEGTEKLKVLMKNGHIISAWSLKTGMKHKDMQTFNTLLDAIKGNIANLNIEYDDKHFPKIILLKAQKDKEGSSFVAEIKDYKCIDDVNYTIDIRKERVNEFEKNHQKWMNLNAKRYTYIYQDSKEKEVHDWGVEVTIENERVIKARDVQSYQLLVELNNQSFLTVRQLFGIVEKRLESNRKISVLYNKMYGYPYWISYKENNGNLHTIFSRNFKKEF